MEHQHHSGHITNGEKKEPILQHNREKHNPPMGHEMHDHHAMMTEDFKKRFIIVLLLTIPVLLKVK